MSYEMENQYKIYCGMSSEQADDFMRLYLDESIPANRFEMFVKNGAVMRRHDPENKQAYMMLPVGWLMLGRIQGIRKLNCKFEDPALTVKELEALENSFTRLARMKLPKAQGLGSNHMRLLVAVARHPGIVIRALLDLVSADSVGLLLARDLVGCRDHGIDIDPASKYLPLYPFTPGLTVLNWCLNEIKMEGE